MITIPAKVKDRLLSGIKKYQPILSKSKDKDINESDTVNIILNILADVFGYDKFSEITSEFSVKRTFCDLAIKIESKPLILIECKAIGINIKDEHIKQALDYGSNAGIEWIILTNGMHWKIFRVIFSKPINNELLYEFDFNVLSGKRQKDLELLFYLTREAIAKPTRFILNDLHAQKMIMNKYVIGQILLQDITLDFIKKTIRKISSDFKVADDEIYEMLTSEVLKREILEGDKALEAKKKVLKALKPPKPISKPTATEPKET